MVSYSPFLSLFHTADALTAANARIVSLEAELDASRKAWDVATAAKVVAKKTAKSAATKAKKAEKALADADQGHVQREQAITKHLNQISTLVGGKYCAVLFVYLPILLLADVCSLTLVSVFCVSVENAGVSLAPLQPNDEDPLMAAVNLLESNWISVQEILELTRHVLTRMFVGLSPKKRVDMLADDLKKLAATFDTIEDPILAMKSRSVK
jgi:hypothetical protein